jgi:Na+-driven multidrug efflux pump
MVHFSTSHIAAFGLASRLESVAMLPVMGFSMGLITLVGMFYGAKRYDLLREICLYAIRVGLVITCSVGLVFFILPSLFLKIFTVDPTVIQLGAAYLRLDVFTFPLMAISMIISRIMQGMGLGFPGLIINLIRVFLVAIPASYIFVFVLGYGYLSIAVAMILGGLVASIIGLIWMFSRFRKLENHGANA